MLLTIELPDESIVTHTVKSTMTLNEIAILVHVETPIFFCSRWEGQLGTLMTPMDQPISYFNTDTIVVLDRNCIKEKDVPRYYKAMTKGY